MAIKIGTFETHINLRASSERSWYTIQLVNIHYCNIIKKELCVCAFFLERLAVVV